MFLSGLPWQEKLAVKGFRMARVKATDLVLGEVQIVPSYAEAPLLLAQRTLGREVSRLSFPFATSETRGELELKYVPQLFLVSLLGTRRSAIGQFFSLSQATVPEVCES